MAKKRTTGPMPKARPKTAKAKTKRKARARESTKQEPEAELEQIEKERTERENAFVMHFIILRNGAEAARRAGYSEHNARQMAHDLLTKPYIRRAIDEEITKQNRELVLERKMLIAEIATLAFGQVVQDTTKLSALQALLKEFPNGSGDDDRAALFGGVREALTRLRGSK